MKLAEVQTALKAPKGQFNSFGNYRYRSCEDILEALKVLLYGQATVVVSDEIVQIGERYYVRATATFKSQEEEVSVSAYAREAEEKKGMDAAQITGATSSYARKYALNGLFAIDDTKDADSDTQGVSHFTAEHAKAIKNTKNVDELKAYWEKNKGLGADFAKAVTTRKAELSHKTEQTVRVDYIATQIAEAFGGEVEESNHAKLMKQGMRSKPAIERPADL